MLNRTGDPVSLRYDDGIANPLHVGDRTVSAEGLNRLIEELRELLLPTEFTDGAFGLVSGAYGGSGTTLADGFARAMYAILGDTPLVIASSRNPRSKRLAADIFATELQNPNALYDAVVSRTALLQSEGFPTPIVPKVGSLFITHDGERRALDYSDGSYSIRGTDRTVDTTEAITMAHESPEVFSPNVALRPIVQEAIKLLTRQLQYISCLIAFNSDLFHRGTVVSLRLLVHLQGMLCGNTQHCTWPP